MQHSPIRSILSSSLQSKPQSPKMASPNLTAARVCLTISAIINAVGPYMADWSESHVKNPRWPPHAKFHNGQTMSTGLCLGLLIAYYTWRPTPLPKDSLETAAILGTVYWVTSLSGILYPGALAVDPEFGEGFPQFWPFLGLACFSWVGYWLAT